MTPMVFPGEDEASAGDRAQALKSHLQGRSIVRPTDPQTGGSEGPPGPVGTPSQKPLILFLLQDQKHITTWNELSLRLNYRMWREARIF